MDQHSLEPEEIDVTRSPAATNDFIIADNDPTDPVIIIADNDPTDPVI